ALQCGSPPRVWGKQPPFGDCDPERRFTPTRVGKTRSESGKNARSAVHPHACGENMMVCSAPTRVERFTPTRVGKTFGQECSVTARGGSPPRVWGKPTGGRWGTGDGRFTPTRVGKTPLINGVLNLVFGSPPRVWGKRCQASAIRWSCAV